MATQRTTEDLVRAAQAGDARALEELLEAHRGRLLSRVARRLGAVLRGRVEAADIVQETYVWAIRSLPRFRWRGEGSFTRWLGAIADHMLLKAASPGRSPQTLRLGLDPELDAAAGDPTPSRALRREERFERLREALESLSPEHREVIVLARIEGLRIDEIARRLDRTPNAVSLLLARALRKLRAAFGDTESLGLPARLLDLEGEEDADGAR
jgi:RNA polymerase sigma-70 factor (ECF subfamily)